MRELFRDEIARALQGVKDPGLLGFMTVTDLELSVDMKTVTVYYSILGTENDRKSTAKALERAAPYLRQVLRKRLTLKMLPHIAFSYDDTPRKAARVERLLQDIEEEKNS
ncbi:MAG: 30S ribosome-binding factor RbfA [Elusimicrobia bacterium]|nr:30S ribosome-binding factor RbfA [Elusimicrobiota bacterium]